MRIRLPLDRDRRAIAIGGLVVMAAWISLRVLPAAVRGYGELKSRHALAVDELRRSRALLDDESVLRDSLGEAARRLLVWAPRLIPGETRAEAEADLAATVRELASRHRAAVLDLNPVTDSTPGVFPTVAVRVRAEGDITALGGLIREVEAGERLLLVRSAQLTVAEPVAPATQPEVIRAELVVAGVASPAIVRAP